MNSETQDDYDKILARFYDFSDGVIRKISVLYHETGPANVELQVATRDSTATENEGWVNVRIVVRNVSEFVAIESPRTPIQVLSQGIHVLRVGNQVAVEFGGAIERPESLELLRSSDGYAVGQNVEFDVGPY